MNPTLNTQQSTFYDRVVAQDFSKILLTGEAGTGKTFCLTLAMADLFRRGHNVVIVAPTHLARLNLIEKLPLDIRHRVPTMTVASLLKRFGFDRGDGTTQFTAPSGERLKDFDVIAIDEVSMIGQKDYDVLKNSATKIIYSGDFAQLPAVMAKSAKDDILGGEEKPEHFHFTQQMRQIGVIHQVAERNRHEVFFPDKTLVGNSGESVIVHNTREDLMETMASQITSNCADIKETTNYRYICHTNDGVSQANDLIRSQTVAHFLNKSSDDHFVIGETLMMYENTPVAFNGEIVEVIDVWKDSRYSYINNYPWESYKILIKSNSGVSRELKVIPPRHRPLFKKFLAQLQSDLYKARIHAHSSEADEIYEEIKHITSYWTNVNYPYAVTCHKSQGMTIANVFLDTLSFSKAPGKKSLLYVGLSRASINLHTVRVAKSDAEIKRDINTMYREVRMAYEAISGQSYLEVKKRTGLPTGTAQEKQVFAEYLAALISDLEQEGEGE